MIEFLWLIVMLSPAVMSVVQVFPSLWCWVSLVLSIESVGLPSVVMWGDRGEIRCCGLSKVWNGWGGCDLHDLWLVMLKSAKNWVIGVDTPGQQVLPHVRYGFKCCAGKKNTWSKLIFGPPRYFRAWVRLRFPPCSFLPSNPSLNLRSPLSPLSTTSTFPHSASIFAYKLLTRVHFH
jgi:hypothetical protein